jgi:hypothetical protein
MKKIILLSLACAGFLVTAPLTANALDTQEVSLNSDRETNVLPTQVRPPYQIGYTVHYRSPRDQKWTLEGFHLERRDAESAARRLRRLGFRTKVRSRVEAEHRGDWGSRPRSNMSASREPIPKSKVEQLSRSDLCLGMKLSNRI